MELNKIYNQDCLEFMSSLPDCSVDMIVTSPPYNFGGFSRNGRKRQYDTYSDDMPEEEYRKWITEVLISCSRILKEGGVMYWNHKGKFDNYSYYPPFWVIDCCPIQLRQHIIWKYNGTPDVAKNKFYPYHEDIFCFSKGKPAYFNEEVASLGDVWEITIEAKNSHPAPFPLKLAKRCISASCPMGGWCTTRLWGVGQRRWLQ